MRSSNSAFGEIEWFETGKQHWIVTLVVKCSSNSAFGEIEWFETGKTALDRHTGSEMQ